MRKPRVTDRGWNRIKRELRKANRKVVKVGVQEAETRTDGVAMTVVAAANEFGTDRIPERSFIRSSFDEQLPKNRQLKQSLYSKILAGTLTTEHALGLLGQHNQSAIRQKIIDVREPPNAPSTVARKGSSNPLVDTGQLGNAIRYVVTDK